MPIPNQNKIYGDRVRPTLEWADDAVGAVQSFRDEVDINNVVARYMRTGLAPEGNQQRYVDAASILSFQQHHDAIAEISSQFEQLPASERQSFPDALSWFEATQLSAEADSALREPLRPSDSNDSGQDEPAPEAHDENSS